jgi:uracil-DNA glycosylase family 4
MRSRGTLCFPPLPHSLPQHPPCYPQLCVPLDLQLRRALADRIRFYNELGIYDFYRREVATTNQEPLPVPSKSIAAPTIEEDLFAVPKPESRTTDPVQGLRLIREDLGDCTRCPLHKQGRKQIVFGVGNPSAELMFIGEAPGADEDQQGEPFVGRAGQLLNNMIKAMGIRREDVYIANIIKCRPPGNRTPEREECETCSPFLMRQIAVIQPKVIVALGAVAAKTLLAINAPMAELRGHWYDFRGTKLAVTYHPAFLLRDPRQKKETWKDLQMVMKFLGLPTPSQPT